jgi:phage terminase small subunit
LIDPDRALREAARLAFSDVRQLFDADGRMLAVKDWPDDLAAAIGGIEVLKRNIDSKDGKTEDVIKVKVWDKPKNIEFLLKHLGLLVERHEVAIGGLDARIRTARDRASAG